MTDAEPPFAADPAPRDGADAPHRPGGHSYVYMVPFTFSCVVLAVVPLVGEVMAALRGGGTLDFSSLRPLALLTGAAFAIVLLLRGLAPDYQIFTVVSLVVSLALALLENMLAGQALLFGGIVMQHSLATMSTFVQATFFSAAAAAAWLAPGDDSAQPPPAGFLRWILALLAAVHFLLPCDMVLQSIIGHWGNNALLQAAVHDRIRVGLWCLVAAGTVLYAMRHLRRLDRTESPEDRSADPPSHRP